MRSLDNVNPTVMQYFWYVLKNFVCESSRFLAKFFIITWLSSPFVSVGLRHAGSPFCLLDVGDFGVNLRKANDISHLSRVFFGGCFGSVCVLLGDIEKSFVTKNKTPRTGFFFSVARSTSAVRFVPKPLGCCHHPPFKNKYK